MSNLRIGGLASGIDTQGIIEQMMRVERMPLDKMMQKRQTLEWQRDDYREINRKLQEFRVFLSDNFARQATLNAKTTSSSNTSRVTATARADAGNTSFTLSKVTQLATAATNFSSDKISGANKINPNARLYDHFGEDLLSNAGMTVVEREETINVKNSAKDFKLAKAGIADVTSIKVGNEVYTATGPWNVDGTLELESDLGNKVIVKKDGTLTFDQAIPKDPNDDEKYLNIDVNYKFNQGSFSITTYDNTGVPVKKDFTFDGSMTLNQIISEVNRANAGVNLFYDEYTDTVSVTRTETGNFNANGKEIEFDGGFLTNILKLDSANEQGGDNAKFTINGLETERSTNTFTINGTDITLKETFSDNPVVIGVSTDVDKVVDSVKEFITKYNEMIDLINGKLTEERYRSFKPLSDEQKSAMSEREVEMWEEKARSGLLRNDPTLSSGLSQIRMALMQQVEGLTSSLGLKHLSEIGIVTSKNYMDGGKLELDSGLQGAERLDGEARLRKAIAEDPEGFYQMFMGGASDSPQAEQGIARRVIGLIDKTIKENIEQRAGNEYRQNHQFTLGRELDDVNKRISNFERRLQQLEDRYWRQFSAMESSLAKLNSQSESLMSFMMSLSGAK